MEKTTIKVSRHLVTELNKLKIHPRQSNEEVIKNLISQKHSKNFNKTNFSSKDEKTTIKVSKELVSDLNNLKIHPRQSNEEVIWNLLNNKND